MFREAPLPVELLADWGPWPCPDTAAAAGKERGYPVYPPMFCIVVVLLDDAIFCPGQVQL